MLEWKGVFCPKLLVQYNFLIIPLYTDEQQFYQKFCSNISIESIFSIYESVEKTIITWHDEIILFDPANATFNPEWLKLKLGSTKYGGMHAQAQHKYN